MSIVLVLLFHLGLPVAQGGLVGVTTFFVLSGFLITSLLVTEVGRTGSIDLWAFYGRRARRLLPALVVAVTVVFLIAAVTGQADAVMSDSVLALSYLGNWARVHGDLMGVWNHAWSLAIEEQFYLLWPLLLMLLLRFCALDGRHALGIVVALAALSAAGRAVLVAAGTPGDRIYFGSDTRAEALLAGCALALLVARRRDWVAPRWAGPAALLALIGLAMAPAPVEPWPGAMPTLVAVAACILILAGLRPDGDEVGLASRPLVWLGERSYSLYLWHVPVILFLAAPLAGVAPAAAMVIASGVSVVLAAVSYSFVERPFRRVRPRPIPAATLVGPRVPVGLD